MKRCLAVAALLMTLVTGAAPGAFAAVQGGHARAGDTSWGGSCATPLCKPIN